MTRIFAGLMAFIVAAVFSTGAQGQVAEPCNSGATMAEVDIVAASQFVPCGTFGTVEVVFRARVIRLLAGPEVDPTFLGVLVCPGPDVVPGVRRMMCIGETQPDLPRSRMDSFRADNRPRLYMRPAHSPTW